MGPFEDQWPLPTTSVNGGGRFGDALIYDSTRGTYSPINLFFLGEATWVFAVHEFQYPMGPVQYY